MDNLFLYFHRAVTSPAIAHNVCEIFPYSHKILMMQGNMEIIAENRGKKADSEPVSTLMSRSHQ